MLETFGKLGFNSVLINPTVESVCAIWHNLAYPLRAVLEMILKPR